MKLNIPALLAALVCGHVFGLGLSLSGMLDPVRVQAFLDVTGAWSPDLAFVLGGAVAVSLIGVAIMRRSRKPVFDHAFHLPTIRRIDRRLVAGSAMFGIGWGLGGLCPGPAIAALTLGSSDVVVFVIAMAVGMLIHDQWARVRL